MSDIRACYDILLQGSELTEAEREAQLYGEFEPLRHIQKERILMFTINMTDSIPTQSSVSPQFSNQPSLVDNCQMDTGSTSTDNLIESLTNTIALLRTSSNGRNKATVQDDRVVVQDVRSGHIARDCPQPMSHQDSEYFIRQEAAYDLLLANGAVLDLINAMLFDLHDVDEAPTTQSMFMDPIYDEAGPSYDSNNPFEVHDHEAFVDHMNEYHEYVEDNEEHVVQCNASSVRNDALMLMFDEMHEQGVQSRLANKSHMVVNDSVTSELARL
ncbi:hypothetical protein Tco_0139274 [Tanacetum coccineum]